MYARDLHFPRSRIYLWTFSPIMFIYAPSFSTLIHQLILPLPPSATIWPSPATHFPLSDWLFFPCLHFTYSRRSLIVVLSLVLVRLTNENKWKWTMWGQFSCWNECWNLCSGRYLFCVFILIRSWCLRGRALLAVCRLLGCSLQPEHISHVMMLTDAHWCPLMHTDAH